MTNDDAHPQPDAVTRFRSFYLENVNSLVAAEQALNSLLRGLLTRAKIDGRVTARVKSIDSCIEKYERKYREEDPRGDQDVSSKISDLLGARIILIHESDIDACSKLLKSEFEVQDETDKTKALALHDNAFGYKGLHLDLKINKRRMDLAEYRVLSDITFEVQVRSIVQDAWSEVDHRLKYKKSLPDNVSRRVNRLAALFELADQEFDAIRKEVQELESLGVRQASLENFETLVTPFNIRPIYNGVMGLEGDFPDSSLEQLTHRLQGSKANLTTVELKKFLRLHGKKARNIALNLAKHRSLKSVDNMAIRVTLIIANEDRFRQVLSDRSKNFIKEYYSEY